MSDAEKYFGAALCLKNALGITEPAEFIVNDESYSFELSDSLSGLDYVFGWTDRWAMRLYDRSNEKLGRVFIIRPMQDGEVIEISQTLYPYGRSWREITNFILAAVPVQEFLDSGAWDSLFREVIRKGENAIKSFLRNMKEP